MPSFETPNANRASSSATTTALTTGTKNLRIDWKCTSAAAPGAKPARSRSVHSAHSPVGVEAWQLKRVEGIAGVDVEGGEAAGQDQNARC